MLIRVGSSVRLLAVATVSCAAACFHPVAAQLVVRETSLGVRPEGMVPRTIDVSAAMRLGYVVETPAGDAVVVDGVRGPLYSDINTWGAPTMPLELRHYFAAGRRLYLTFSPDGKRFASAAKQGERALVVVDGTAGPLFDAVHWDDQPFSPDSRHVAYVAAREGSYVAVRDGVVGPAYDAIRSLTFTADSRHVIYVAQRDGREYVVMDGKEVGVDERVVGTPMFSVARNRLAYKVKKGDSTLVVVDGKPGKSYPTIGARLQFTRDGRVVYSARDSLYYVVVDGVEGRGYPFIGDATVALTGNGEHVAYVALANNKAFWVLDGRELKHYDGVDSPRGPKLSRDGARLTYAARAGRQYFVVIGEKETARFDRIDIYPDFAPDGRVIYTATRGERQYVGVDTATSVFEWVSQPFITTAGRLVIAAKLGSMWDVFIDGVASAPQSDPVPFAVASPDGRRIASAVRRGATWFVASDGVVSPAYDEVRNLTFSRDSRHLAYVAKRGDKWTIVMDGAESPAYDEIIAVPPTDRLGDDSLTVLARRGAEDFRVTIPWPRN